MGTQNPIRKIDLYKPGKDPRYEEKWDPKTNGESWKRNGVERGDFQRLVLNGGRYCGVFEGCLQRDYEPNSPHAISSTRYLSFFTGIAKIRPINGEKKNIEFLFRSPEAPIGGREDLDVCLLDFPTEFKGYFTRRDKKAPNYFSIAEKIPDEELEEYIDEALENMLLDVERHIKERSTLAIERPVQLTLYHKK